MFEICSCRSFCLLPGLFNVFPEVFVETNINSLLHGFNINNCTDNVQFLQDFFENYKYLENESHLTKGGTMNNNEWILVLACAKALIYDPMIEGEVIKEAYYFPDNHQEQIAFWNMDSHSQYSTSAFNP